MAAKKKRKTARRKKRSTKSSSGGGNFSSLLFGLSIGLSVAAGVWVYMGQNRPAPAETGVSAPPPAVTQPQPAQSEPEEPAEERFTFYRDLTNYEVVIPEEQEKPQAGKPSTPVEKPGVYVLQAGSFANFADADRQKANLALLGVVSRIEEVTVNNRRYHRVRVGPSSDLNDINRIRDQLAEQNIEALLIKVGE